MRPPLPSSTAALPRIADVRVDAIVLAFGVLVAIGSGALFGVLRRYE